MYKYCRLKHSNKTHKVGQMEFGNHSVVLTRCRNNRHKLTRPVSDFVFTDRKPHPDEVCKKCFLTAERCMMREELDKAVRK